MTCALYFGSFNPIHYGHLSIIDYLCASDEIDQVRLIVSPKNPLKESLSIDSAQTRFSQAQKAIDTHFKENKASEYISRKLIISDIEFHLPSPLYTLNTLRILKKNEPLNRFILIIGGDNISILKKWYGWEDILKEFEVWVYPRPGYNISKELQELQSIKNIVGLRHLSDAPQYNISSTEIRNKTK